MKIKIALGLLAMSLASSEATVIHSEFDWTGVNGYRVLAPFSYDDSFSIIQPVGLKRLTVDVFSPTGELLQREVNYNSKDAYDNYSYLFFRYYPTLGTIYLDIGADPGYGLIGGFAGEFELILFDYNTNPTVDFGNQYTIRNVPDNGSTLMLLVAVLVAIYFFKVERHDT